MQEILAPAGGPEQLLAAVRCGAGAVYLGTKGFNARQNAANFDESTLPEAVAYCHARGVRVYVTVNTLVTDSELEALSYQSGLIAASGADGVIIQDMAVLRLFRESYPSIERLASTQTAVHNVGGARLLEDMGFDRIVLARELSLSEMEQICSGVNIQTEAFVHGAHCMSVSGACYLSSMIGGRSGNRGLCAQPCRLNFRSGSRQYALSLKDMSLIPHLRAMADVGIDSFKIEGRMKRPEYVAAAVTACTHALRDEPYDTETLQRVFSRSGFTDGYLKGERGHDMFGYRRREDVTGTQAVLQSLQSLYKAETPLIGVDMHFYMEPAQPAKLELDDGTRTVTVSGELPQAALSRPTDLEAAERNLTKTGGTPFFVRSFCADIAPGLYLPAASLNGLRRDALGELLSERSKIHPPKEERFDFETPRRHDFPGRGALWGRFLSPEQIVCSDELDKLILPARKIDAQTVSRFGGKLIAELPALLFPSEEVHFERHLAELKNAGLRAIMTDNIYGIRLAGELKLDIHGGAGLNITNTCALSVYEKLGLVSATASFELSMRQIKQLGGDLPRGIAAYGHLPLMRLRACPAQGPSGCGRCDGAPHLTDRLGIRFPMVCEHRYYSTLLNNVPVHIAERDLDGLDFLLLYFTGESPRESARIVREYQFGQKSDSPRTGGLYYRELL